MTRYHFDERNDDAATRFEAASGGLQIGVRVVGVLLLLVGLVLAIMVVTETWTLFQNPDRIDFFVDAVERGSNIDRTLSPDGVEPAAAASAPPFRLAYFAAWVIAILLLMLLGQLAIAAIRVGGELALYDARIKRLLRELSKRWRPAADD